MKNIKQVLANHIEELETRSEVKVTSDELKDDLPFFERSYVPKPLPNSHVQGIDKDDQMIKRIEENFSKTESQDNEYRFK